MHIGVILYPYGEAHPAGLAETIYRFSESLVALDTSHTFTFFSKGEQLPTPEFLLNQNKHQFKTISGTRFWLDKAYKDNPEIDLWIYNMPILPLWHRPKKAMAILADFGYLELETRSRKQYCMKQFLYFINYLSLKKVAHAVTISEFTRLQALKLFSRILPQERVTTVWAGYRDLSKIPAIAPKLPLPEVFYLTIGVIKERKNQLHVIEAFLQAKAKGLEGSLVVAGKGKGEYYEKILNTIKHSAYAESVIMAGYVSDTEVVYLYQNARALVFPSKLEGFGFPVLEAMSLGTPVITSNTTSLVEVAGDSALLVNPESVPEIVAALLHMEDQTVREAYIQKGFSRIHNFSWKKTAECTMRIIESL